MKRDGLPARLAYGAGAISFGVKDQGLNTLLLAFYSQVLGLRADLVGLALGLALLVDAVADPLIGAASDRTRSRLGRRHPWMYAAAIPAAVAYALLWNPPALEGGALFAWLLGAAILTRLAVSAYEIPSASQVAELAPDYHLRTRFIGWRYVFGWGGGIAAGVAAFALFLSGPAGVLDANGYRAYGLAAAALMVAAMLGSAWATRRLAARSDDMSAPPRLPPLAALRASLGALANRPFLSILGAAFFSFLATGVTSALNIYLWTYLWGLPSSTIAGITLASFIGVVLALILSGLLSRRFDKRRAGLSCFILSILIAPMPVWLRLAGVFPENGDPLLAPLITLFAVLNITFSVTTSILATSMLTDAIDMHEAASGDRRDGLYFAANFFVQKCVTGAGLLVAGLILSLVAFPRGAKPGAVPATTTEALALGWAITTMGLLVAALLSLSRYPRGREAHARAAAILAERRAAAGVSQP